MRDRVDPSALPRAPTERAHRAGSFVVPPNDVRCQTPGCKRKLAIELRGTLVIECPRCRQVFQLTAD